MNNPLIIEKIVIDITTGNKTILKATVANKKDSIHTIYSLVYEGWRSKWTEISA